jgi:hypothetical protein
MPTQALPRLHGELLHARQDILACSEYSYAPR